MNERPDLKGRIKRPRSVCHPLNFVDRCRSPPAPSPSLPKQNPKPSLSPNPLGFCTAAPPLPRVSMTMFKFWGVEVKPGQTVTCDSPAHIIHVTQVALVETKKGSGNVVVSTKIDDQKVIIGTLSAENHPQILCDLKFQKKIELSHNSKTASVFVCGYQTFMPEIDPDSSEDEDEVQAVNNQVINNVGGIHEVTAPAKDSNKGTDGNGSDDDSDDVLLDLSSSGDDELTGDDSSSEEDGTTSEEDDTTSEVDDTSSEEVDTSSEEDDTSSEESSSDEEDEETLKEPVISKKRVAATALKVPASDKKAKIATPSAQKTAKQAKMPANSKPKKSPKSTGGTVACKSCSKTFGSDVALKSHEKAKHE